MTVETDKRKEEFLGPIAVSTVLAIPFRFLNKSTNRDLKVRIYPDDDIENVTELTFGTDFTVTGGDPTGSVTSLISIAAGINMLVYREENDRQSIKYQPNDDFPEKSHEEGLDKSIMINQELRDELNSALKQSLQSPGTDTLIVPESEEGKVLGWKLGVLSNLGRPEGKITSEEFDVTGSPQTVFNVTKFNVSTNAEIEIFAKQPGAERQLLRPVIDYNITSPEEITLVTPIAVGGDLVAWQVTELVIAGDSFTGIGSDGTSGNTVFDIGFAILLAEDVDVYVNRSIMVPIDDYTRTGNTEITFGFSIPDDVDIYIKESIGKEGAQGIQGPPGIGDMLKIVFDPTAVEGDVFAMGNMVEGATNKILTSDERDALHDQNSDTKLDEGQANEVTSSEVRVHLDVADNPHNVTASQVGITIGDEQIAVGGVSNTIGGSSNLTFDGDLLEVGGVPVVINAENSYHIFEEADFAKVPGGSIIAGKINLVADFTYFIDASFSIGTDSFVIPSSTTSNVNFINNGFNDQNISCDGAGDLFEDTGIGLFNVFRVNFTNTDGLRTFGNPTASANPLSQFALVSCLITGFLSVGFWDIRSFISECAFVDNINGITFNKGVLVEKGQFLNTSDLGTTFFTFPSTFTVNAKIEDIALTTLPNETMFNISSSVSSSTFNRIVGNTLIQGTGTIFDPGGLDQTDFRVLASENSGIRDSTHIGAFSVAGNAGVTSPGTIANGFVDFVFSGGGLAVESQVSERIALNNTANGEQINNAQSDITLSLSFSFSGTSSANNTQFGVKYLVDQGSGYIDLPDASIHIDEFTMTRQRTGEFTDVILLKPGWKVKPVIANTETDNVTYVFSTCKQQLHKVG